MQLLITHFIPVPQKFPPNIMVQEVGTSLHYETDTRQRSKQELSTQ